MEIVNVKGLFFSVNVHFQISSELITHSHQYVYIIQTKEGICGFGGGVGSPPFVNKFAFKKARKYLISQDFSDQRDIEKFLNTLRLARVDKHVIYGLEMALYDLYSPPFPIPSHIFLLIHE